MADEEQKPNIKWVGVRPSTKQTYADDAEQPTGREEPPKQISIGNLPVIEMPSAEEQATGFYHKDAVLIVSCMPGYKLIKEL